ncbi:MutS-related protein [uncultured Clostridium sp.]|uniref:MutS family DNA mismatch repair protein n=1 Tax=uncultured Clostridium sp. TaxID=59620 RepID=UPI0028F150EC|nr:DNA mismatch repair protein [uncultured Clostridium sp.]
MEKIIHINEKGIDRIEGKWRSFKEDGEDYIDEEHQFSGDLDLFGPSSLFQYINCTNTFMGKIKFKSTLEDHNYSEDEIIERQEAIKELGKDVGWRQRFEGEGILKEDKQGHVDRLLNWCVDRENLYSKAYIKTLTNSIPLFTIVFIILSYLMGGLYYYGALSFIFISVAILFNDKKKRNYALQTVFLYKKYIESYYNMISLIEKEKFHSEYLVNLKEIIVENEDEKASTAIKELMNISNNISDRSNFFYAIFNVLFLLDYKHMIKLEMWKEKWGDYLKEWLEVVGEFESLSSISVLGFENPNWVTPTIQKEKLVIRGKKVGHPLLGERAVKNDFSIGDGEKILLITGSNMSGKSTFLRTTGINLLLAYMGAPVFAEEFTCSLMDIYTCMRISDNLERNISSFYGELLRINKLIEGVKIKKPIFFLLDEIFKGTNSVDRHTGAKILINKLSKEKVLGLVSTHDLELGSLEEYNSKVKNYHFREYYKNNEIHFDYKLRKGISTTRNALYLMKIAGIEVEEE